MEILAISGSVREGSYNSALLNAMSELSSESMNISMFDAVKEIPVFDPELDDTAKPAVVLKLISMIREADGVIISTPEYAHNISGVLKNLLDWLVASDAVILKPIMVTSVSTTELGGMRGLNSLITTLFAMNALVVTESSFCVPHAKSKFDDKLGLSDEISQKRIEVSLLAFEAAISKNR